MKKVSVIVPVYNVEKYVSKCLESICSQSYENLEILIIYDQCGDHSLEICQGWEKKDSRIRVVINKKRCGLGAARNIGLKLATGDYVMYLDSDDWCETYFVSELVYAIERGQADYVAYSGIYWETEKGTELRHSLPCGWYCSDLEKEMVLLREFPAVWKKIYRRKWLIKRMLYQPELFHYEDWGYNIPFVLCCDKIELLSGAAVHYRSDNVDSMSNERCSLSLIQDLRKSIEFGITELEKRNLLNRNKVVLYLYFFYDFSLRKVRLEKENNQECLRELVGIRQWLLNTLGLWQLPVNQKHIAFGSFAARWIMQHAGVFAEDLEYFGFTSLISAMTEGTGRSMNHSNKFRKRQIENDISGYWVDRLRKIQESTIIFIDFLEERNGILKEDTYIADSEAYREIEQEETRNAYKIEFGSDEFRRLWKCKCKEFIEILSEKREYVRIYLICSRLALKYGNLNRVNCFENLAELEAVNREVESLENDFIDICEAASIDVIPVTLPKKYQFTDEEFTYGCYPYYMNHFLYTYMGYEIAGKYLEDSGRESYENCGK